MTTIETRYVYDQGYASGRADERARCVAWLCSDGSSRDPDYAPASGWSWHQRAAKLIEAGEHWPAGVVHRDEKPEKTGASLRDLVPEGTDYECIAVPAISTDPKAEALVDRVVTESMAKATTKRVLAEAKPGGVLPDASALERGRAIERALVVEWLRDREEHATAEQQYAANLANEIEAREHWASDGDDT